MRTPLVLAIALLGAAAPATARDDSAFAAGRAAMIADIRRTVSETAPDAEDAYLDRALMAASRVEREKFVPRRLRRRAYLQTPLPIGYGQTISDAYIVAVMTAAARMPDHANVLDVGTGSGYQAAILSLLADRVSSIEIVPPLARRAARRLARMGYANVTVRAGDGYAGWSDRAPFDAIIVAAGAAKVPQALLDQLKPGGRLVMPVGPTWAQEQLLVMTKSVTGPVTRCSLGWTMFVPLTGEGRRVPRATGLFDRSIPLCHQAAIARVDFQAPDRK